MSEPQLILASQSPRRRELLQLLGLSFEVTVADVAEVPKENETPAQLVTRLSRAKAEDTLLDGRRGGAGSPGWRVSPGWRSSTAASPPALVIACDTVVALEETSGEARILGKPRNPVEAAAMLNLLRGRSHFVYSAVTVLGGAPRDDVYPRDGVYPRATTELVRTQLTMRVYTDSELAAYVASGDPLDKAGAYAIQHEGFHPVQEIEGCYASVMGLPLCHLARCLRHWGHPPTTDVPAACQAYTGYGCQVGLRMPGPSIRRS